MFGTSVGITFSFSPDEHNAIIIIADFMDEGEKEEIQNGQRT